MLIGARLARSRIARLPVPVIAWLILSAAMLVPAGHALATGRRDLASIFAGCAAASGTFALMLALAVQSGPRQTAARGVLLSLIAVEAGLPLIAALPLARIQPDTGLFNAWWEMLSCLTTTGATLYAPDLLPPSLHLWRAVVGWLGGLFMLSAAVAMLAPLRVGGFEILDRTTSPDQRLTSNPRGLLRAVLPAHGSQRGHHSFAPAPELADPAARLLHWGAAVAPMYAAATLGLWVVLRMAGQPALPALLHALGTLSTSGIDMTEAPVGAAGGTGAEAMILGAMLLALSRRPWPGGNELTASDRLGRDPELRMAAGLVALVTLALVLRPLMGLVDVVQPVAPPLPAAPGAAGQFARAAAAAWGGLFTALSFLTTTGWTSVQWEGARAWSGLSAPGLMLAGLAIMGGGVATAAGGVKLLRVHALAMHSRRELEKIVHPASVAGGGETGRRLRGDGAYLAFVFFMTFALSIAVTLALVSLRPVAFETATMLSVAALTNTGPLAGAIPLVPAFEGSAGFAGAPWAGWAGLTPLTKAVLAAAMVAGRVETLALLALLAPGAWRRQRR